MDNITPQPGRPDGDLPNGDTTSSNLTRTLAGILIGAVLAGGVLVGAFWAVQRSGDSGSDTKISEAATDFEAEKARITLWFQGAVRSIVPTVELIRAMTPEAVNDPAKLKLICQDLTVRVDGIGTVPTAPNPTLDGIYRDWVATMGDVLAACNTGDLDEFNRTLALSDADFRRFNEAVAPFLPEVPNTPQPAPTAPAPAASPTK